MKRKTLRITAALLADFLRHPASFSDVTQEGMPEDAVIEAAAFDASTGVIDLLIASSQFEIDGGEFAVTYRRCV